MRIILHTCCSDCLLRYLIATNYPLPTTCHSFVKNYSPPTASSSPAPSYHLFFSNPNIYPKAEYQARLQAVQRLAELLQLPLTIADYQPHDYFNLPLCQQQLQPSSSLSATNSRRCLSCQTLRLQLTLSFLQTHDPTAAFSTTMLASAYLDQTAILTVAKNLSPDKFFAPNFTIPPSILQTSGFYKQNYCGCLFSLNAKTQVKYLHRTT